MNFGGESSEVPVVLYLQQSLIVFFPFGSPPLTESESVLLTGCWVDAGRKLRLAAYATDLDRFVEIDFEDSERTTPRQVVGGKSGLSAKDHKEDPFGCGVFLGRWRPDSQLKPDQRMQVAVKVMRRYDDFNRDGAFHTRNSVFFRFN
jgi:hypothetical protein